MRAALLLVARGEAPLGIVYSTDAASEPNVKIVATFPADRIHPSSIQRRSPRTRPTPTPRRSSTSYAAARRAALSRSRVSASLCAPIRRRNTAFAGEHARAHAQFLRRRFDSLAQSCGLSLPTFNQRGWLMSSSIHAALSPAGIASTEPNREAPERIDLANRIVAYLRRRSSRGSATWPQTANRFRPNSTPRAGPARQAFGACPRTGSPSGPEVRAGPPVKTTPTGIASGPAQRVRQPDTDEGRQEVHRAHQSCEDDTDCHRVRTCPSAFIGAARQPETDGGRQAVEQADRHPPSQEKRHDRARWSVRLIGTASMTRLGGDE